MLCLERLSEEAACSVLKKYDTENIKEFTQEILEEVAQGYVLKIRSTDYADGCRLNISRKGAKGIG